MSWNGRGTTDPSTRSAGAQGREERGQAQARKPGEKIGQLLDVFSPGDVDEIMKDIDTATLQARYAELEKASYAFASQEDFEIMFIENELKRRGVEVVPWE